MSVSFLFIMGTYAVAGCVLMAAVVGCFWDGWHG